MMKAILALKGKIMTNRYEKEIVGHNPLNL